jgi:toxin-antitoxin system PIN domain toxin
MGGVVDTNLLLYAANSDADEHGAARDFLLRAGTSAERWYLTEGILYEFLRACTHPKVFARPLGWREAMAFLRPILASPRFELLGAGDQHWRLLEELLAGTSHPSGNLFFDMRTVVLMREHGVRRIYTRDTDFLQFAGIEVIDPLRGPPG